MLNIESKSILLGVILLLVSVWGLGILNSQQTLDLALAKSSSEESLLRVTDAMTHTTYLPLVNRFWNSSVPPFGIQFYGTLSDNRGLTEIAEVGVRWVRMPLSWASIERENTTPEEYDWSRLDTSVIRAEERNLQLILTIAGQPSWAAEYAMGPVYDVEDIKEFVGALVSRYDGTTPGVPEVLYFELYNEPDNADLGHAAHGGWGYWGLNGDGYAALLRDLYPVVKAANPDAQLVFGGMAMDWFIRDGGPFDENFLEDVLAVCQGHDCFDVMNFHYYPVFRWDEYGPGIMGKATYIRQMMDQYGFVDEPIICTEMGWDSEASWGSTELQSRYPAIGYIRSMAADLPVVIWFSLIDLDGYGYSGLLDGDYQIKPSYGAYQTMTEMLGYARYQRPLTLAEKGSDQIEGYVFEVSSGRMDVVWTVDDTRFEAADDPVLDFEVRAETLRVVDKYGGEMLYSDADDGQNDGRITLKVEGSPQYLVYNP